jgi:tetratricopeptide (TPR) repeat protein
VKFPMRLGVESGWRNAGDAGVGGSQQFTRSIDFISENYFHGGDSDMKAKFLKSSVALLVFTVTISVGAGVSKAQYGGGGKDTPAQPAPGTPAPADKGGKPAPVNKAEEAAYKALYADRTGTPESQIPLCEDFIAKFPQSHYLMGVYSQLTTAYFAIGQEDKMFVAGTKALELNPDNVDVLALLAMAMPRRVKATTPDAQQQYQKAEGYARHAIELIPNLTKPDTVDDATFEKAKNDKLSMAHSGLGLIDIQHQKYEDARTELTLATQLASSPDPVDYFLLGNADVQASYYNDAVAAYEKCAASGPLVTQCKSREESAKKDATTKISR